MTEQKTNNIKLTAHARELLKKLGQSLATIRDERNLTLEDIHDSLKIHVKHLEAIERGLVEELPSVIIFFRSIKLYAKFLGKEDNYVDRHLIQNHHLKMYFHDCLNLDESDETTEIKDEYLQVNSILTKKQQSSNNNCQISMSSEPIQCIQANIKLVNICEEECLDLSNYNNYSS